MFVGTRLGRARATARRARRSPKKRPTKIRAAAKAEIDAIKQAAEVDGKEAARKRKAELDEELEGRRDRAAEARGGARARRSARSRSTRKDAERRAGELEKKEKSVDGKIKQADAAVEKAEAAQAEARKKLEQIAGAHRGAGAQEARGRSPRPGATRRPPSRSSASRTTRTKEATARAKTIVATAIQRFASEFVHERTVAVVPLPSDDLKGRLIGREGRNIRALEAATGIDMIIDDTAEAITISCFNPVRREVARLAISRARRRRPHPSDAHRRVRAQGREGSRQGLQGGRRAGRVRPRPASRASRAREATSAGSSSASRTRRTCCCTRSRSATSRA